jgi:hypothetical protein
MPTPRNSLSELSGRAYGWLEPAYPSLPTARRYVASDIACPNCAAEAGTACPGPRVCLERVHAAIEMLRAGALPEAPERGKTTEAAECEDCGTETTQRGRPVACSPGHRCQRILTTRKRCAVAVERGTRWCMGHTAGKRWN